MEPHGPLVVLPGHLGEHVEPPGHGADLVGVGLEEGLLQVVGGLRIVGVGF